MNSRPLTAVPFLCLVLACAAGSSPAEAASSYDSCTGTIGALPAVISASGTWCMNVDRTTNLTSGSAITVTANNVTIDCNGFRLGGLAAGMATGTTGINATDRVNVVVRDCHVRGFRYGLQGSGDAFQVVGNRFEANTQRGIWLTGDHHTIRDNLVTDTGGSTIGAGAAYGIALFGSGDVLDNTIGGAYARAGSGSGAWGVYVADGGVASHPNVVGNRIRHVLSDGEGAGSAIRSAATGRATIVDNAMFGDGTGVGIRCANNTGAVRGNSILGFATGRVGCSNEGGNVAKP